MVCGLVLFATWACRCCSYFETVQICLNIPMSRNHGSEFWVSWYFHVQPFGDSREIVLCDFTFGSSIPASLPLIYTYAQIFQYNQPFIAEGQIFLFFILGDRHCELDSNRTHDTLQLDFGQFYLTVEGNGSDDCYTAFIVIPGAGYRNTDVKLSVIDPKMLDYDNGTCNDIIVKVRQSYDLFCRFSGIRMEPRRKLPEYTELPRGIWT